MSVMESDETTPPLVGYVVLEVLDFVVDPKSQESSPIQLTMESGF